MEDWKVALYLVFVLFTWLLFTWCFCFVLVALSFVPFCDFCAFLRLKNPLPGLLGSGFVEVVLRLSGHVVSAGNRFASPPPVWW
jgi:hypothetical protein